MEQISAERRREENIRKNREFHMQIGLTKIAENGVGSPPEKKFRQEYIKRENIEVTLGNQEELRNEWKTKEIDMKKCRKEWSLAENTVIK